MLDVYLVEFLVYWNRKETTYNSFITYVHLLFNEIIPKNFDAINDVDKVITNLFIETPGIKIRFITNIANFI